MDHGDDLGSGGPFQVSLASSIRTPAKANLEKKSPPRRAAGVSMEEVPRGEHTLKNVEIPWKSHDFYDFYIGKRSPNGEFSTSRLV